MLLLKITHGILEVIEPQTLRLTIHDATHDLLHFTKNEQTQPGDWSSNVLVRRSA